MSQITFELIIYLCTITSYTWQQFKYLWEFLAHLLIVFISNDFNDPVNFIYTFELHECELH